MSNDCRDIVILGCSPDVEMLCRHLELEAPAMLERIIVIDPRPGTRDRLQGSRVDVRCEDPLDTATLRKAGVEDAAVVVTISVPGTEMPGTLPAIVHRVRSLSRVRVLALARDSAHSADLRVAGADDVLQVTALKGLLGVLSTPLSRAERPAPRRADGAPRRLLNWRFALLIAITIVDAIVFVIPLASSAVLVAAMLSPNSLRRVARFLDDLAGPGGR